MTRGRRPDPEGLQDIKGNPGKRKRPAAPVVPEASGAILKPIGKVTPAAVAVWRSLAPELERMNILRTTDRLAFSRYCQDVVTYWDIAAKLRREGHTYLTETVHGKMKRINPLFLIEERLGNRLTALEDRFGLSPQTRQQLLLRLAGQPTQLPLALTPAAEGPAPPPSGPIGILSAPPGRLN